MARLSAIYLSNHSLS
uniref:Uncharacterized protein n=1 Tax=Arundo donax TaxID=35708 RepID=A0A0A9A3G5_ARUDO